MKSGEGCDNMEYVLITMKRGNQLHSCRERFFNDSIESKVKDSILRFYQNHSIEEIRGKHDLIFWKKPPRIRKSNGLQFLEYLHCPGGLKEYKEELSKIYYKMRYANRPKDEVIEEGIPFDKDPDFVVQTEEGEKFLFLDYHELASDHPKTWLFDLDEDMLIYKEAGENGKVEHFSRNSIMY